MASKQMIKDLQDKEQIRAHFLVNECQTLVDKNGKTYMSFELKDSSGSINGRLWDNAEKVSSEVNPGDFVLVKGHAQLYQSRLQVVLHQVEKVGVEQVELKDFVAQSEGDPQEALSEIEVFVRRVADLNIRSLLENTLNDPEVRSKLLMAPAARSIHHAYLGGLVEHVLSILKIMDSFSRHYSFLNFDYLVFGAIYHDIGKVYELAIERGIQYTDSGQLVGHMGIACEMIDKYSAEIPDFSREMKDLLKHIIYSHHGRIEYGSLKLPSFPEAFLVAAVDELDSKISRMVQFMKSELGSQEKWSRYHQGFDRYFFLDILRERLEEEGD